MRDDRVSTGMIKAMQVLFRGFGGLVIWLGFAVVFFYSGLYVTELVMAPEQFAGGWRWMLVGAFPLLLPAFFLVNRRYACAGACRVGQRPRDAAADRPRIMRMPGA